MATLIDWSHVNSRVVQIQKSRGLKKPQEAFPYLCLDCILRLDQSEISASITDGGDDRGIDAVYLDTRGASRVIHFFQFKYVDKFENTKSNFPSGEIDKIESFLSDLLSKNETLQE